MGRLWSAAAVMGKHTADLSTSLPSGRDDKGWGGYGPRQQSWGNTPQISRLRCRPVEMTKGGRVWFAAAVMGKHTADLSLRCAPVEMTKGGAVMVRGSSHGETHR